MGIRQLVIALLLLCSVGCATVSPTLRTMHVVDFMQRNGAHLDYWQVSGEDLGGNLVNLIAWAKRRGIRVAQAPTITLEGRPVLGLTTFTDNGGVFILLDSHGSANSKFFTLVHELAHVYGSHYLRSQAAEVYAELIAAQVCQKLGMKNALPATAAYLQEQVGSLPFQWKVVDLLHLEADVVVQMLLNAAKGGT
jgi:hypothetical protein